MASFNLLLLAGDGIGTEVMAELEKTLSTLAGIGLCKFELEHDLVGGAAYDVHGTPITSATVNRAQAADVVLLGAVGGPRWDHTAYDARPEAAILRLRKELGLFANLRPAICYSALADASPLKRELVEGLDLLIVRELTGGIYFSEPKEIVRLEDGQRRGVDTQVYKTSEIERIAALAFQMARKRSNKVSSSEKRNVMKTGQLWRATVTTLHREKFADVELENMLADNCAMQLVREPKQFDMLLTDNLVGDILSDVAGTLTGSLGMLPSAALGEEDPKTKRRKAMYEPVHGSAPDIAGKGLANPIAMIGSLAMALRYSMGLGETADFLDQAIANVLCTGFRTKDLASANAKSVGTSEMGDAILKELRILAG